MREFVLKFTEKQVFDWQNVCQLGHEFFLLPDAVRKLAQSVHLPWCHAGQYLGMQARGTAKPGIALLEAIAGTDVPKVWLGAKSAWLFVCKRPALAEGILRTAAVPGQLVLVLAENDDCIGYGMYDGKKVINYYDIGDFLRRERRAGHAQGF
jgi:ribosome biogenesis protein Nip4